jgi:hypothetical protein
MEPSGGVLAFVVSVIMHCWSLKHLTVNLTSLRWAVSDLILGQVELERLEVPFLAPEILAHIAGLRTL